MKRTPLRRKTPLRARSSKRAAYAASDEGKAARAHMLAVKALPCVICGAQGPNDAHHVQSGRYGTRKASDWEVIPLCRKDHTEGPQAYHRDKRAWEARHGPDHGFLPLVAEMLKMSR